MFNKIRKYIANKIYSQDKLLENMTNYISQLHDTIEGLNKFASQIITPLVEMNERLQKSTIELGEFCLENTIIHQQKEIEQLKEELLFAQKALLKALDKE